MKLFTAIQPRRALCALLALLLLSALTACGGGEDASSLPEEQPEASATPNPDDEDYDASAGLIDKTVYSGTVLEETKDAGREYLDETLFLGDSNTYRYMMYADESGQAFSGLDNTIGVVSMGAGAIPTLKCMQFKGQAGPVTMPEAVAIMQPLRIIICFGTNNLGGGTESFIKSYKEGLAAIHKAYEYADIIVSAVPPLDQQRENGSLSMKQVDAFNAAIAEMCKEEGYKFLDTSEALKDPVTGWARKDYTLGDGVHLSKDGVTALFSYIRTHAYITEDTRPKPLKPVPKAEGVPPGLISQDPIAVRGARVPVEFVAGEGGTIEGEVSQKVKKGQSCTTVTAVPDEGWEFDYWTVSYGSAGGSPSLTFTVPGDADANGIVITAHFKESYHEHVWDETERVQPTCAANGVVRYKCKWCDERREDPIPATGHSFGNNAPYCGICGTPNPNYVAPTPEPTPVTCPNCGGPHTQDQCDQNSGGEGGGEPTPPTGNEGGENQGGESEGGGNGGDEPTPSESSPPPEGEGNPPEDGSNNDADTGE